MTKPLNRFYVKKKLTPCIYLSGVLIKRFVQNRTGEFIHVTGYKNTTTEAARARPTQIYIKLAFRIKTHSSVGLRDTTKEQLNN